MLDLNTFLKGLAAQSPAIFIGLFTAIVNGLVVWWLQRKYEHRQAKQLEQVRDTYAKQLEMIRATNASQLEIVRASLAKDHTRFNWVYERRAKLIVFVYRWLSRQESRVLSQQDELSKNNANELNDQELVEGKNEESYEERMKKRQEEMLDQAKNRFALIPKYPDIALLIAPDLPQKLDEIAQLQLDSWNTRETQKIVEKWAKSMGPKFMDSPMYKDEQKERYEFLSESHRRILALKQELENQFRDLLGVELKSSLTSDAVTTKHTL